MITLTLTENTGYTTVFQKEYTVKVQAAPVPVTVAPAVALRQGEYFRRRNHPD